MARKNPVPKVAAGKSSPERSVKKMEPRSHDYTTGTEYWRSAPSAYLSPFTIWTKKSFAAATSAKAIIKSERTLILVIPSVAIAAKGERAGASFAGNEHLIISGLKTESLGAFKRK